MSIFQYYRDVLVSDSRCFGFRCGHVCQILDHLLGIFSFTSARFTRAQNRLILTICACVSNIQKTKTNECMNKYYKN